MLEGTPSQFCSYCYKEESVSGQSYRTRVNEEFKNELYRAKTTKPDGYVDNESLAYLDVRFSNTCNLKCRSCNAENSTSWYEEYSSLIPYDNSKKLSIPSNIIPEITSLAENTQKLYFAGGEPLLEIEHYKLLNRLIDQGKTDILLSYNTNMTTLRFGKWDIIELWKKFRYVQIGVSLDGIGNQFELLRKGANWDIVKNNILKIKSEVKNSTLNFFPTVGTMNSFHLTRLIEELVNLEVLTKPAHFEINYLHDPIYLNISILNKSERAELKNHYVSFLSNLKTKVDEELYLYIEKQLNDLVQYMESQDYTQHRTDFQKFTLKLDQFRKEKTVYHFPELFNILYPSIDHLAQKNHQMVIK